jgi:hypothetical protein
VTGSAFGPGADRPVIPTADDMVRLTEALYVSDIDEIDRLVTGGDWDPVFVLGFLASMCAELLPLVLDDCPDVAAGEMWAMEALPGADAQATPALRLVIAEANEDTDMRRAHTAVMVDDPELFAASIAELMKMYRDLMHLLAERTNR